MQWKEVFCVLFLGTVAIVTGSDDTLVCKPVASLCERERHSSAMESRIIALEEQVRQLQLLIRNTDPPVSVGDKLYADCEEILKSGVTSDGVYIISPDGRCPFEVFYDMSAGGWTVIQRRQDGSANFHKNWNDYVTGFGDVRGEHWLGLDKIHRLTKEGNQIYFQLEFYNGKIDYAHYQSFVVHDVTTTYRMNVDAYGYNGSIPDLLSFHDNMKFSTFDRDNDVHSSKNCAEEYGGGGGWWFKDCWRLGTINGVYGKKGHGGISYWQSKPVYFQNVHVMLKRRKGMC